MNSKVRHQSRVSKHIKEELTIAGAGLRQLSITLPELTRLTSFSSRSLRESDIEQNPKIDSITSLNCSRSPLAHTGSHRANGGHSRLFTLVNIHLYQFRQLFFNYSTAAQPKVEEPETSCNLNATRELYLTISTYLDTRPRKRSSAMLQERALCRRSLAASKEGAWASKLSKTS